MSKVREDKNLIVGLDIGTSKIVTIVAELLPEGTIKQITKVSTRSQVKRDGKETSKKLLKLLMLTM